jgi:PAS domain S-box-containing protein
LHFPRHTREHLHGLTFDQIKSGILIIDPESHTILDVNPEAARMIGLPPAEIIGKVCHRYICPAEERKCPITDLHQVVDNAERILITASMKEVSVLKTVHRCKEDNKEYLIENFIDISTLKANQEQVKKGENLVEQIYETSGVGMALLQPNAAFFRVNSAFCRLTGYSQDELLSGKFNITHPDDLDESEIILKKLSEHRITSNITEKRYIKKNGETVHAIQHASVIQDVMGFPHLFVIQAEDITPLKKAMAKAEESDRLKTAFLHNLSHEVRTPANAIQGFSQLLNLPGLNQAEREQYFDIIKQSVTQLLDILNDPVEIAKLETNQVSLLVKKFNISTFLRNIYKKASKKFNRQMGHLRSFKLEIPEGSESMMVTSDEFLLEQCMMYLLSNAFKFTSHGEVKWAM